MEGSKAEKRIKLDDSEEKLVEPSLVRINKYGCAPHNIHIDKNEFKIGRARDNDEIILDAMISRKHCILRYEENEEWTIKDLSSSVTFVNDIPLTFDEYKVKKPKIDENILDNVFIEQKTFAQDQECQKNILKDKLQIKQKQQEKLKQQLKQLLRQQNITKEDTKDLKHQIILLENKIKHGNVQEQYLQNMYTDLLEKLENERIEFEKKLNEEKQKWQEALNVSKLEKEMLELKMKEQMEKWREEQQTKWKNVMENRVKEEKKKALKEQAKIETINSGTSDNSNDNCIFLETKNPSEFQIIDTIDLTIPTQVVSKIDEKESVLNKINDIMDEQLTCTICSELFVKATTLNCMHTFCQYCINIWNKKRKECPICRASVSSMNRSIVLDNFIESMLKNLPIQFNERRKEILEERQAMEYKKKIR
ncbi:E3 ubiquitin-protein ligase RNF8-like [Apis laboriosa]|uniref:E3 ubiquitin-protein ligase RNF8-like n=1 Tax=Apis laboriosa TaxID=183418 RepID=UPI001CC63592|nr:E3 ubiquitin-protein ligase RNF8-like [Apis laboriosa]